MLKINVFSRSLWLNSAAIGSIVSVCIGLLTYKQSLPNLDSQAAIHEAYKKIDVLPSHLVPEEIDLIKTSLSPYNTDIFNARLLMRTHETDLARIKNPELLKLKDTYRTVACRMFAVREYGIAVSILVGLFSVILTTASTWTLLCGVWYAIDKLKNMRTRLCSREREYFG